MEKQAGPECNAPIMKKPSAMNDQEKTVIVVDDDHAILKALEQFLAGEGYRVRVYADPDDFLRAGEPAAPSCLLLDNQTGVEVHQELQKRGWFLPTVFLTAHWNVQSVVDAMRAGADGFISKPFEPAELLREVAEALERAARCAQDELDAIAARSQVASLTARERQIVSLVLKGLLNKEIADELNLALITVKVHRGRAMHKLGAGNAAEMARIAGLGGLS